VQIASVNAPGSVFGEQAVLLDQPHTADVRTLEQSEFYVADAPTIPAGDPIVALYVAAILARRLDTASRWLVAVKSQLRTGEPPSVIGKARSVTGNATGNEAFAHRTKRTASRGGTVARNAADARNTEEFLTASINQLIESRDQWQREAERLRVLLDPAPEQVG
jgi:CRP-like cAMP-binding protein